MNDKNYCFVDVETTGGSAHYDRIIEVGIVRVENGKVVRTYNSCINPNTYLSPFITEITGITASELETAPLFEAVAHELIELMDGCIFVAHNARFDYGFLKNEFKRLDIQFNPKQICSVKLSKLLFPQFTHHNLDSIIERFHIPCKRRHRAYDDAYVIWQFFQAIYRTLPEETLKSVFSTLLKQPSLPAHLPVDTLESLPELPGVYIFYGDSPNPLYIGKSVNIKERVLSHFNSDYSSAKEMNICQQATRIESIPTAGELGALLLESSLIKQLQPMYNRMLRNTRKLTVVKKSEDKEGYMTVSIEEVNQIEIGDLEEIFGIFKSRKQAKDFLSHLVKDYQLCERRLNLEKTKGSCFSHKLGICKGACIGKENRVRYNMRFTEAFVKYRIKQWPFKGPVVIGEEDKEREMSDQFILDKWCLIDKVRSQTTVESQHYSLDSISFDYDTYKILVRYVFDKKHTHSIRTLSHDWYGSDI